jgi:hypothetical protein
MTFAPHTVTHPILARATDEESRREIVESWKRLRAEATRPLQILAYPNGRWGDFGQRETDVLRASGYLAAVVNEARYVTHAGTQAGPDERYKLGRFGRADSLSYAKRVITGAERLRFMFLRSD